MRELLLLLTSFLFVATQHFLAAGHIMPDDRLISSKAAISNAIPGSDVGLYSPVVIVELPKPGRKKKAKKNKLGGRRRPPPPAGCVPLWGNCKSSGKVCCDFCAFCHCRVFRTVCYCRMGNPRC
ncbi:agouti signaling protein 1 [Corythoichthys intestinalis]|uniref:agouti signaling protein 1 n=1 Tax=Corythoichthys intestinalis TaxID=161448 RepID=UPI0025A5254D|nr:agouti signaling protein 1 [Corythoichthys intestinalis]